LKQAKKEILVHILLIHQKIAMIGSNPSGIIGIATRIEPGEHHDATS
jgi:hypothetical protein